MTTRAYVQTVAWRVALGLLIAVTCCEVTLRIAGHWYLRRHYAETTREAIQDKVVILCLGESSTAGLWTDVDDSYPKQLEKLLNVRTGTDRFVTAIPLHIGQNTSHMANRIESYLELYDPTLVILMAGVNNEWSLGESSVARMLKGASLDVWLLRSMVWLSHLRTYKLARYLQQRIRQVFTGAPRSSEPLMLEALGHPRNTPWPPRQAVSRLAMDHRQSFVEAWRYDMRRMLGAVKERGVKALLMTYHIHPSNYLSTTEFVRMAREWGVPLARQDLVFARLMQSDDVVIEDYVRHDHWHPNADGYRVMAEEAFRAIERHQLLPGNSGKSGGGSSFHSEP